MDQIINQIMNKVYKPAVLALFLANCAAPQRIEEPPRIVEIHHYHESAVLLSPNHPPVGVAIYSGKDGDSFVYQVPANQAFRVEGESVNNLLNGLAEIAAGQILSRTEVPYSIGQSQGNYSIVKAEHYSDYSVDVQPVLLQVLLEADIDKNKTITSDEIQKLLEQKRDLYSTSIDLLKEKISCRGQKSENLENCVVTSKNRTWKCQNDNENKESNLQWTASSGKEKCYGQESNSLYYAARAVDSCTGAKSNANYYCQRDEEKRLGECDNAKYHASKDLESWKGSADWACQKDPNVAVNTCCEGNQVIYDQKVQQIAQDLAVCQQTSSRKLQQCSEEAEKKYTLCNDEAGAAKEKAKTIHSDCLSEVQSRKENELKAAKGDLTQCLEKATQQGEQCLSATEKKFSGCEAK